MESIHFHDRSSLPVKEKYTILASLRMNFYVVGCFLVTFIKSIYFLEILDTLVLFPVLGNSESVAILKAGTHWKSGYFQTLRKVP